MQIHITSTCLWLKSVNKGHKQYRTCQIKRTSFRSVQTRSLIHHFTGHCKTTFPVCRAKQAILCCSLCFKVADDMDTDASNNPEVLHLNQKQGRKALKKPPPRSPEQSDDGKEATFLNIVQYKVRTCQFVCTLCRIKRYCICWIILPLFFSPCLFLLPTPLLISHCVYPFFTSTFLLFFSLRLTYTCNLGFVAGSEDWNSDEGKSPEVLSLDEIRRRKALNRPPPDASSEHSKGMEFSPPGLPFSYLGLIMSFRSVHCKYLLTMLQGQILNPFPARVYAVFCYLVCRNKFFAFFGRFY